MIKGVKHSYRGMNQDISKSKYPNDFYYEGKNIRIVATDTQSTGSITNEKGNELIISLPTINIDYLNKVINYGSKSLNYKNTEINDFAPNQSGEQKIIGHSTNRNYIVLFTTDNNGFDCIWKLTYDNYDLTLVYLRNLNFNTSHPIQVINNFENEKIDKIYWVNGVNQMQYLNLQHSIVNGDVEELIDLPSGVVNMVGKYKFDEPKIVKISKGGIHTSGMIQYAYNLYRLNASQTKLSPLSKLIPLNKGDRGGNLNEIVGTIPVLKISNLDTSYTHIKVYAIKYTSYNEIPSVSLISDEYIPSNGEVDVFDDGNIISSISLDEFLFLGSDIITPKHINSKFNRLFFANYKEINFNINLDTRAYSFNSSNQCTVYNNVKLFESGDTTPNVNGLTGEPRTITNSFTNTPNEIFDSINLDYDVYKYQYGGLILGGEGKYLKYELVQNNEKNIGDKYFKDNEIYRLGIQFYNIFGQVTTPNWIADFKAPEGNLEEMFNKLKVTLKNDFYVWLNNSNNFNTIYDKPVGYKLLIAQRNINDRTILSSGILSTMLCNDNSGTEQTSSPYIIDNSKKLPKLPNILLRNCDSNLSNMYGSSRPLKNARNLDDFYDGTYNGENPGDEAQFAYFVDRDTSGRSWQFNSMMQMYSPEILFGFTNNLPANLKFKVKGAFKNSYNASWIKENHVDGSEQSEGKIFDGISPHVGGGPTKTYKTIKGKISNLLSAGIIGHPTGSDPNHTERMLFYRNYGNLDNITDNYTVGGLVYPFQNNLVYSLNDGNVDYENFKKIISIKLGKTNGIATGTYNSDITFTVTPDPGYTTVPYDVKLCKDVNGVNIYTGFMLTGVTGTQNLNETKTFIPSGTGGTYYIYANYGLILEANAPFSAKIDVVVNVKHNGVDTDNCTTTNNPISTGPNVSPTAVYYERALNNVSYDIYGSPEITEVDQKYTNYNNDVQLRYTNTLESFITDGDSDWEFMDDFNRAITSINATNNRCVTFVLNNIIPPISSNPVYRPTLEQVFINSGITGSDFGVIGEFIKNNEEIYLSNIYGGNSYESKRRTNYIEIGEYKDISLSTSSFFQNNVNFVNSPGDTIVERFRFLRIITKEPYINVTNVREYEEIIDVPVETTVDLINRNDDSLSNWDAAFRYTNEDYHKYNKVYSQKSDLIIRRNTNFNFKKVDNFDTNVIVSKLKINNEIIDSWTDILLNETLTLDGKYGSINSLHNFKDELFTIQDSAIAFLSILPRVQVQSSDGIGIELGEGNVLQRYKYISIEQGTRNKWSVINSPNAFYFYDVLNNTIQICSGNEVDKISDLKGMHTYFIKNINKNKISQNNPVLINGVTAEYDNINNEIFFTFLQENDISFTLNYNELTKSFVSFYDYIPTRFISKGDHFLAVKNNNQQIYRQYVGEYNKFFDEYYPSSVILNVNPESDLDCVFNNLEYKSEVYINNIDQPNNTLTNVRLWDEYQDTGTVPLVINSNLSRKFRDWRVTLPRKIGSRDRIRNPWIFLKLDFENNINKKLVLHDLIVYYTI